AGHPVKDKLYFKVHVYPDGRHIAKEYYEKLVIEASDRESLRSLILERVQGSFHVSYNPKIKLTFINVEYL
ncbi:MAG: hypothetical protein AAF203_03665, partial [Pseudomonadota bacterium]